MQNADAYLQCIQNMNIVLMVRQLPAHVMNAGQVYLVGISNTHIATASSSAMRCINQIDAQFWPRILGLIDLMVKWYNGQIIWQNTRVELPWFRIVCWNVCSGYYALRNSSFFLAFSVGKELEIFYSYCAYMRDLHHISKLGAVRV